jgi:hypothetical protein
VTSPDRADATARLELRRGAPCFPGASSRQPFRGDGQVERSVASVRLGVGLAGGGADGVAPAGTGFPGGGIGPRHRRRSGRCGAAAAAGGGAAAVDDHVPVPLHVADGVAAGQRVAVLGQRVGRQAQVAKRALQQVGLEEPAGVGAEAAGAHVEGLGAGVVAAGGVAVGVDRRAGVGVALGEGVVAVAVGGVAVAGRAAPLVSSSSSETLPWTS